MYFYDSNKKVCHYKALVEITDNTSPQDKDSNRAIYQVRVEKGELSINGGAQTSEGYLELSNSDLDDFLNQHFEVETDPNTQLSRETITDQIKFSYPAARKKFSLIFKIKAETLKSAYNSKPLQSPLNPILKFKDKELNSHTIQFQIEPKID